MDERRGLESLSLAQNELAAMIITLPARLMNVADYGIAVGHPADLVVLDSRDPARAVAELAAPLFGVKRGRRSFTRAAAALHYP
jgi:cytosine/creatinine deaminase